MKNVLQEIRKELQPKYSKMAVSSDPNQKSLTAFINPPNSSISNSVPNPDVDSNPELNTSQEPDGFIQEITPETPESDLNAPEISSDPSIPPETLNASPQPAIKWDLPIDKLHENEVYMMVDSRETNSPVVRELSSRNVVMDLQPLVIADYIVSERVGIERKAVSDLIASVKDGRLFDELIRLRNQFSVPMLIIEGDLHNIGGLHPAAILGALSTIMLNLNIFIYQTATPIDTSAMLIALAKKEQSEEGPKKFAIRFKKVPDNTDRKLEYIVAGIPGINVARAQVS